MDRTAGDWERCLEGMSDAQAVFKPATPTGPEGEDEWCTKEVLGHVLASQRGLNVTIAQMAGVEPPAEAEQIRAMGVKSEDDEARSLAELRPRIAAVCEESKRLVTSLPEGEKLEQKFPHPDLRAVEPEGVVRLPPRACDGPYPADRGDQGGRGVSE